MKRKKRTIPQSIPLITLIDSSSQISEYYRTIRTNIQFSFNNNQPIKTVVITSSRATEGKSTASANLAIVFAQSGKNVLLVDADLRKPTVHKTFSVSNKIGLSTLLIGLNSLDTVIQETSIKNLEILTSGLLPPNPSELFGTSKMKVLIEELEARYDFVIFDMPPLPLVTDAQIVAANVDGAIILVNKKSTKKNELKKTCQLLNMVNAKILGTIIKTDQVNSSNYYYLSE